MHADAFIERLPDGYASAVAERGATLSVGQKQLLSFARALAFDPRVLILDEATSSVDTETELLIRDALHVLMAGRTTIAIAHRLSTIQDMDKILVLHKGQAARVGHAPGAARRSAASTSSCSSCSTRAARRRRARDATNRERLTKSQRHEAHSASECRSSCLVMTCRGQPAAADARERRPLGPREQPSMKPGVVAFGFQPRRSTVTCTGWRPNCSASLQLHM